MPIDNMNGPDQLDEGTPPQSGDPEAKMRLSLGLAESCGLVPAPPLPHDPNKAARNAIRSQAAAREYVERQLAHAQGEIEELRTKLRNSRYEKASAAEALRSALSGKAAAEAALASARDALAEQKSARERSDRALLDARATIKDLQGKLDAVGNLLQAAKAELTDEREARLRAEAMLTAPGAAAEQPSIAAQPVAALVKRPVGRPRKVAGPSAAQPVPAEKADRQEEIVAACAGLRVLEPVVAPAKRPVGRPRKTVDLSVPATGLKAARKPDRHPVADQEPVQWWTEGWTFKSKK